MLGILLFLGINILCFVPAYLVNIKNQKSPLPFFLLTRSFRKNIRLILWKNSSDIIRINLDFAFFFYLACITHDSIFTFLAALCCVLGCLTFLYSQIMNSFFERDIALINDLNFLKTGIMLMGKFKLPLLFLFFCSLVLTHIFFEYCINFILLNFKFNNIYFQITCGVLFGIGCYKITNIHLYIYNLRTVISPSLLIFKSLISSLKKNKFRRVQTIKNTVSPNTLKLNSKPNIVILSIESLGDVVFRKQSLYSEIHELINQRTINLNLKNIHIASSFSESTIYSGGSWLPFSSFLNGVKIENEMEYAELFKTNKMDNYLSIPKFLKLNAYTNQYLSGFIANFKRYKIDWETLKRVLKTDSFITHYDLKFTNKSLGFGAVDTIPDEYTLNAGYKIAKLKKPFFLFFPTLNSHYPFYSPIKSIDNWEDYNSVDFQTTEKNNSFSETKYIQAIRYQYDFTTNFIEKNIDDKTVFVLFGDHQPPKITTKEMGKNTALYIISKNQDFIKSFHKEGFHNSLDLKNISKTIKHEGFSSLFLRKLTQFFGEGHEHIEVLPDGIKPEKE